MRIIDQMGVGTKATIIVMVSVFTVSLFSVLNSSRSFQRSLSREFDQRIIALGENLAGALADQMAVIVSFGDDDLMKSMAGQLKGILESNVTKDDVIYAVILSKSGAVLVDSNIDGNAAFQLPDTYQKHDKLMGSYDVRDSEVNGKKVSEIRVPIVKDREMLGELAFGFTQERLNTVIREFVAASIIIAVIVAAIFSGLAIFFARVQISIPLKKVSRVAERIAEGDLTVEDIHISNRDEIGHLAIVFNKMSRSLNQVLQQVAASTGKTASSAHKLAETAENMATGAAEQTSQTSQVATSIEEMSATVQQVARNSTTAVAKAREAEQTAARGGSVVEQSLSGMNRIVESVKGLQEVIVGLSSNTERIGNIVEVIDDVADQTNLLALNAAIEAARAGEQGRGFAVVADEVRKLAERTTSSTKEIDDIVRSIQENTQRAVESMGVSRKDVDDGLKLAIESGDTLKDIVSTTQKVQEMIQQIATAAEEQSAAAEQISSSVESIATVSKQNANAAQQTSLTSQEINGLAAELQKMVSKFQLGEGFGSDRQPD